jgi:hypothetical protein
MVVEILSSYLTQRAENLKDGTLRKLHTIALIGAFLLISFMKVANAQAVVAVFVAEKIAGGSLSYIGKRGAESILGEDEQKNITPSQLSNIVSQIVEEQTKQLEATMREIHRESNLFAYRKDLEDGLNSMESLLRNYNTRASTDTRMQRIRSILNYAATVEGAFQTFFRSETLNKHYPELFFTYYATYGRFAETFIVLKAEEQAVNNLMAAEGIKGYKEVDSYEVAKAASDKLALIHKFWYENYPGFNLWINRFDDEFCGLRGNGCSKVFIYRDRDAYMNETAKPICLYSNRIVNANGDPFKKMRLASSWGRAGGHSSAPQGLNKSLARDMDLNGLPRHYNVEAYKNKICENHFPFYALSYLRSFGTEVQYKDAVDERYRSSWTRKSLRNDEVRRDDWTGPIVPRREYVLFNYYQTKNTKGIIEQPKFKAFLEPLAPVALRTKLAPRKDGDRSDDWQFTFANLEERYVYTFSPKISSKKVRECQIVSAFGLYNGYLKHLTGVDFNNKSFVGNLHELVAKYNDGKNDLLKNADSHYNLLTNENFAKNCRNGK